MTSPFAPTKQPKWLWDILDFHGHEDEYAEFTFPEEMPDPAFWNGNHPRQEEYEAAHAALVPAEGEAGTTKGDLLCRLSNIACDIYNNGGCNLLIDDLHEAHQRLAAAGIPTIALDQLWADTHRSGKLRYSTLSELDKAVCAVLDLPDPD